MTIILPERHSSGVLGLQKSVLQWFFLFADEELTIVYKKEKKNFVQILTNKRPLKYSRMTNLAVSLWETRASKLADFRTLLPSASRAGGFSASSFSIRSPFFLWAMIETILKTVLRTDFERHWMFTHGLLGGFPCFLNLPQPPLPSALLNTFPGKKRYRPKPPS